jgi:large subunit ribosomal protein L35
MFTLCRLRAITAPLARANSTLESLSTVTSTPLLTGSSTTSDASTSPRSDELVTPPPERRTLGRRNPKYPPIRPSISLERPREWNPPVAPGVVPAFDEAVAYIRADAAAVQAEADTLRSSLENGQVSIEGIEDAKERLDVLEIMAQVNLPEVRWKAANGMGLCFILPSVKFI